MTGADSAQNPTVPRISPKTTIQVTAEELSAFERIKAIYPDILAMLASDVFDFKNGRAIIHRDSEGKLRKIDLEVQKYKS